MSELLAKGFELNDKEFAKALRQIANNVEDGELGVSDAMDLIDKEHAIHVRVSKVIVGTIAGEHIEG